MSGLLRLSEGLCASSGVAPKASMLDRAGDEGLDVPAGFVVPDGMAPREAAVEVWAQLRQPLAVRSAFGAEDQQGQSLAGHFESILHVRPEVDAIRSAIEGVLASGDSSYRRDVLVMEMVDAEVAGVAFTEPGWADDLINFTAGVGDRLLSGEEEGARLQLDRLQRFERSVGAAEEWQERLARLLRSVRQTFGDAPWDVEWADDGETCWLLQVRPITARPLRDEVFSLANHKEILPDPPSVFMSSLIAEASPRLTGPMGIIDGDETGRRFIEVFDERPYVNHSLITDFLRTIGLPSRLVADTLGGDFADSAGVRPLRMLTNLPTFVRMGWGSLRSPQRARAAGNTLEIYAETSLAPSTFEGAIEAAADAYVGLVNEMAALATSMAVPVAALSKLGVLDHHLKSQTTAGTRMLLDMVPMAGVAALRPEMVETLKRGELPDDQTFISRWEDWLAEHGHRAQFESDFARPRYYEDPGTTLQAVGALAAQPNEIAPFSRDEDVGISERLSWPLWAAARPAMTAREELRAQAMRAFAKVRSDLLTLADRAVADGLLTEREDIWFLTTDELRAVDAGEMVTAELISARHKLIADARAADAPDLRSRISGSLDRDHEVGADGQMRGLPLTSGVVTGVAWVLDEPSFSPPDSEGEPIVLVARSVDAGWVATFGLVSGAAIEIGGDLSHGSIILRELGLPAITNVRTVTSQVSTGDSVILDAASGTIAVIGE